MIVFLIWTVFELTVPAAFSIKMSAGWRDWILYLILKGSALIAFCFGLVVLILNVA